MPQSLGTRARCRRTALDERSSSLEINEDLAFERREWRVERLAWVAMLTVVVAAVAGLFGNGPLSRARVESPDGGVEVSYQRYARTGGRTTLEVSTGPVEAREQEVEVAISRQYLSRFRVDQVSPEPESQAARGDMVVFLFARSGPASPLEVELDLEPQSVGRVRGRVEVGEQPALRFSQFVYP